MALTAFALEAIYNVSPHSIKYARKLIEGFLTIEMNSKNGYIIRYDRWHTASGELKEIRGASTEELLGIMLGIMFYLKAEKKYGGTDFPLYVQAERFRDRILRKVSRGGPTKFYNHPFVIQSYWVKHFENAFYASKGEDRGNYGLFYDFMMASLNFIQEKFLENLSMYLMAFILFLEGDLPDSEKERYANSFLIFIKRVIREKRDQIEKNAYLGVVALLLNKYLNPDRDCHLLGPDWESTWCEPDPFGHGLTRETWMEIVAPAEDRIAKCKSLQNEFIQIRPEYQDHWQHNLPFCSIVEDGNVVNWEVKDDEERTIGWISRNLNPHKRIGSFYEWKTKTHWWRAKKGRFADFAIGWTGGEYLNEKEYNDVDDKRYNRYGYFEKEVFQARKHSDNQVEGAGMSLLFLRMLLTHIKPAYYPPPQLSDKNVNYSVLPFRGIEPLEPKFLHYEHGYSSKRDGWKIEGDKDKALRVIAFPSKKIIVTASAFHDDILWVDTWRLGEDGFRYLFGTEKTKFDQIILRKTSSTGNYDDKDILVVAERAADDQHYLKISFYRVGGNGVLTLLSSKRCSGKGSEAVNELDMCILNFKFIGVTFKTRHDKARVKVFELDFSNNQIIERVNIEAEEESDEDHAEIEDAVWIGSAWDNIIINGYMSKGDPRNDFKLFSRRWNGNSFDPETYVVRSSATKGKPMGAVTLRKGGKYFLLTASYYPFQSGGMIHPRFILESWEIAGNGKLENRKELEWSGNWDKDYLFFPFGVDFERMSISRARLGQEGEFAIAAKGFTNAKRQLGYSNQGLIVLYGKITPDGQPSLIDWNCSGSGDKDSVKMVDVCGDIQIQSSKGVITAYKEKEDHLNLTWWRYSEDFKIDDQYRVNPPGRLTIESAPREGIDGVDGND